MLEFTSHPTLRKSCAYEDLVSSTVIPSGNVLSRSLQRIGGGRTPITLFDQALVSAANFVTNVLLARSFGVREYGVFALCWIAVLFVNSLQYAFVITPMMTVGPKQQQSYRPEYFGSVLLHEGAFALLGATVMFCGVLLSKVFFPQWGVGSLAFPLAFVTVSYLLQDFIRRYFFCIRRAKLALATDVTSYITQLPLLAVMARYHHLTLSSVLWVIGATSLLGFVSCTPFYEKVTLSAVALRDVTSRHWKISRWLASSAFLQWGAGNLFVMAAPLYYGPAASAILRAAQNIVGVAHIWFLGLENIVPAEAARRMQSINLDAMLAYIRRVFFTWGSVTLLFVSTIAVAPEFWLKLTYGAKYSGEGSVLRLYALLYLITFVSGPLRSALLALEYTAPIFWAYPAMIAFSAALAGPFARKLGLHGVLLGMSATVLIFQGVIGAFLVMRIRKLREAGTPQPK